MTGLLKNVSLLPYNTFGIDIPAEALLSLKDADLLEEITAAFPGQKRVLGGGSNVLLTAPVKGLVLRNEISGISKIREDNEHVWLQVQAGESWHGLVMHAVEQGLGGIENLALIPGSVGASPIQNIGAYGAEVRETIERVTVWHWQEKAFITLSSAECGFGYRDSIFKHSLKDQVVVTSVCFRLNKKPELRTSYGVIKEELDAMDAAPSVAAVAQAVIRIRKSKLPDPAVIGNAGSFFKNPSILQLQYDTLIAQFPEMPSYKAGEDAVKIPAGWMIESCGLKGYRKGQVGVHQKQALVLVNYGSATGNEIWELSTKVLAAVQQKFGIELEREVQVW